MKKEKYAVGYRDADGKIQVATKVKNEDGTPRYIPLHLASKSQVAAYSKSNALAALPLIDSWQIVAWNLIGKPQPIKKQEQ